MLNRIVLRTVGRIVRDTHLQPAFRREGCERDFEKRRTRTVTAATIAQHQERRGLRTVRTALRLPPLAQTIDGKFCRVVTGPQIDVPLIALEVVNPRRNDDPVSQAGEIMSQSLHRDACLERPGPIEIADQFFFLVSRLITGFGPARYSAFRAAMR